MTWFREEAELYRSAKVLELQRRTRGLGWFTYQAAKGWAAEELSDGFVPLALLHLFCPQGRQPQIVAALVALGFWLQTEGGYAIAGYLDTNPSRATVEQEREAARARRKGGAASTEPAGDVRPNVARTGGRTSGAASAEPAGDVPASEPLTSDLSEERSIPESPPGRGSEISSDAGETEAEGDGSADAAGEPAGDVRPNATLPDALVRHAAQAYADGITRGTGRPKSIPTGKELDHLRRALEAHGEGQGAALVAWARSSGEAYARAALEARRGDQKGFATFKFLDWLDSGGTFGGRLEARGARVEGIHRQPGDPLLEQMIGAAQ